MKKFLILAVFVLAFFAFPPSAAHAEAIASSFTDVSGNYQYYSAINYLRLNGMTYGYSNGTFRPDTRLTRAETVIMLVRAVKQYPSASQYKNCYSDVKTQSYANEICYAKAQGWLTGYGTKFDPNEYIAPSEAFDIVARAYNLNTQNTASSDYGTSFTRAEMADLLYRAVMYGGHPITTNTYNNTYYDNNYDNNYNSSYYSGDYSYSSGTTYIIDPYSVRVPDGYPQPWVP